MPRPALPHSQALPRSLCLLVYFVSSPGSHRPPLPGLVCPWPCAACVCLAPVLIEQSLCSVTPVAHTSLSSSDLEASLEVLWGRFSSPGCLSSAGLALMASLAFLGPHLGWLGSLGPPILQMDPASLTCGRCFQQQDKAGPNVHIFFKPLLVSHLLLFHWPNKSHDYTLTHLGKKQCREASTSQHHSATDKLPQQTLCFSFSHLRWSSSMPLMNKSTSTTT